MTTLSSLTEVASSDDACGVDGTRSRVTLAVTAGTGYRIAVDGVLAATGPIQLKIEPPPANDDFPGTTLSGLPSSATGTNLGATKQAGEPPHAGNSGGHSVWYSWTAPSSGTVAIDTCNSGFDTLLGVYTGSAVESLAPVASSDDSDSCGAESTRSRITFAAAEGTVYRIAVDGRDGATGGVQLKIVTPPANDDFPGATLTGFPASATGTNVNAGKQAGEPDHAEDGGGASVWWSWTAPSSGWVSIDTCGSDFATLLGVYTGSAVNLLSEVPGDRDSCGPEGLQSRLTFETTAGTTYRIAVDGWGGETGNIDLELGPPPPPANDDFPGEMPDGFGENLGTNVGATKQAGEADHAGNSGGASVWWSWMAGSSGTVTFDTCTSDFNTLLAVYTGDSVGSLVEVASNDDACGTGGTRSRVTFEATAGTTYRLAVDGYGGAQGGIDLLLSHPTPAPENDDFPGTEVLEEGSVTGSNVGATKQAGEPDHAGNSGGASVWWSWTAPEGAGEVTVDVCSPEFSTLLGVYTGASVDSLTPVASDDSVSTPCGNQSQAIFTAVPGTTYRIAVDGNAGAVGSIELAISVAPANDDFPGATLTGLPVVTSANSARATKQPGEPDHAGSPGGKSVWWSWTALTSETIVIDTCGSDFDTVLGVYTGSAVNSLTEVASNDNSAACPSGVLSQVTFEATAGITYRIAVDGGSAAPRRGVGGRGGGASAGGPIVLHIAPPPTPPANDDFPGATLTGLPIATTGNTFNATKQAGEPDHAGDPGGHSVWWSWTASASEEIAIDTCGSDFDTLLGVYSGSAVGSLTPVASNDDSDACGVDSVQSRVTFAAAAGNHLSDRGRRLRGGQGQRRPLSREPRTTPDHPAGDADSPRKAQEEVQEAQGQEGRRRGEEVQEEEEEQEVSSAGCVTLASFHGLHRQAKEEAMGRFTCSCAVTTVALLSLAPAVASADTFTVTTNSDSGTGSLRDAVMQSEANDNSPDARHDPLRPAAHRGRHDRDQHRAPAARRARVHQRLFRHPQQRRAMRRPAPRHDRDDRRRIQGALRQLLDPGLRLHESLLGRPHARWLGADDDQEQLLRTAAGRCDS